MNIINYLLENSSFFDKNFEFINVNSGKSTAVKYICFDRKNKYFVKILEGNLVTKIKEISNIYEVKKVPIPRLIHIEYFENINYTCIVYEYIEGKSLLELMKDSTCEDLEKMGNMVGSYLRKFNNITVDSKLIEVNLEQELNEMKKIAFIKQKKINSLNSIDLNRLFKSLDNLKTYVYSTKPKFIHGDITFNNVIIRDGLPYFIDTDGGKYSFRSLDFKGNWWWTWGGENVLKEQALYRGIYKGLFGNSIPNDFHKELAFTMIYTFLCRLKKYKNNAKEVEFTFSKFKTMFDNTSYFENYTFSWIF